MTGATSDGKLSGFPITRLHGWLCALGYSGLKWWETYNLDIADLQNMAVAELLQSCNSVRGPMKRIGMS